MSSNAMSPNHREAITAVSSITGKDEYILSTNGSLTISGGGDVQYQQNDIVGTPTGTVAFAQNGSGGLQPPLVNDGNRQLIVELADHGGNPISQTNNALWVDITGNDAGLALENGNLASISNNVSSLVSNQTNSAQQTQITDGTSIVNTLKSDGTAAGQNSELIAGTYLSVPFTTTTVQSVASTDVGNYAWVSVYINTQGTSSLVTFQTSNNNTNWVSHALTLSTTTATIANSTNAAAVLYQGPLMGRYFRLNVTGISASTTAGTIVFSTIPKAVPIPSTNAFQGGTWAIGSSSAISSAVPANAFYLGTNNAGNLMGLTSASNQGDGVALGGGLSVGNWIYNGTTFDRQRSGGVTGMVGVTVQASSSGGWLFINISTSTTTTVKSGAGTLHLICVNTLGTVASTATVYDNTAGSGTIIAIINTLALSGSFTYDIAFATGCTVVTTGTAAPNITVAYK